MTDEEAKAVIAQARALLQQSLTLFTELGAQGFDVDIDITKSFQVTVTGTTYRVFQPHSRILKKF